MHFALEEVVCLDVEEEFQLKVEVTLQERCQGNGRAARTVDHRVFDIIKVHTENFMSEVLALWYCLDEWQPGMKYFTHHVFDSLLQLSAPVDKTSLSVARIWDIFGANGSNQDASFAEKFLER